MANQVLARKKGAAAKEQPWVEAILGRMSELLKQIEALGRKQSDKIDDLRFIVDDCRRYLAGMAQPDSPLFQKREYGNRGSAAEGAVVDSLLMNPIADGSFKVRIDTAKPFHLARLPGLLLAALKEDTGTRTNDLLVGWKTRRDVFFRVYEREITMADERRLSQLTFRLRLELVKHGYSPNLVQTYRQGSMRFALRQGGAEVPSML